MRPHGRQTTEHRGLLLAPAPRLPPLPHLRTRGGPLFLIDTGFLNIGTPELTLILLVGYFVLGPKELYTFVKSAGRSLTASSTWRL